jgi:predicted nucleic acid-binding protein
VAEAFFDTNVLLYLYSKGPKAACAEILLGDGGVISVQVLNEFASVARRKFQAPWEAIRQTLSTFRATLRVEPLTVVAHERGLQIAERHKLAIDDSMILAVAELARCETVWSEDMHDGLRITPSLVVRNPFASL